jgi:hypothetical protein
MSKPSISSYKNADLCAEIVRRLQNGEELQQFNIISGRTLTFWGRPYEKGYRSALRKGSQRWIALRSVFTGKELMKEIQDRILGGEQHAYNEFRWALTSNLCGTFKDLSHKRR